jgi:microcystin-dependent protein
MANVYLPDAIDTAIGNPIQSSWGGEVRNAIEAAAPAASIGMITTDIAPDGWLAMIGQTVTGFQQTYPVAWTRIPTSWKTGSSVKFPDTRARIMIGAAGYGDFILGTTGGLNEAALTIGNMPPHSHGGATNSENATHQHTFSGTTAGMGHELVTRLGYGGGGFWTGRDLDGDGNLDSSNGALVVSGMHVDYTVDHGHAYSGTVSGQTANHQHQVYQEGNGVPVSRMQAHLAITFIMRVY